MNTVELQACATLNPRLDRSKITGSQPVSFVAMADVSETDAVILSEEQCPARQVSTGYTYFEQGDILVAKITPCFENGKMAVADIRHPIGFGSTEFHVIRVHEDVLDRRYLYHLLRQPAFRVQGELKMKGSGGQKRLPAYFLEEFQIPLLPLDEQRRVAEVLDRADAIRAKRRRSRALLDDLLRSVFLNMFGDPRHAPQERILFSELILSMRNGLSPASAGIHAGRVLTLSAVTGESFDRSSVKEAMFDREPPSDKTLDTRDFLICRGNGNLKLVGRAAFPTTNEPDTIFPDTIIGARIDLDRIVPDYLDAVWRSQHVRDQIERGARTTNGTYKINQGVLESIELPLPPYEAQAEYATIARHVRSLRARMTSDRHDDLYHALAQRAFRGELVAPATISEVA